MKLIKEKEEAKFRMIIEVFVIFITLLAGCTLIAVVGYVDVPTPLRIALIVIAAVVMVAGIGVAAALEMRAAVFECPKCNERFIPTKTAYIMGAHTITRRRLTCPKCGKRSWCKRRLGGKEDD